MQSLPLIFIASTIIGYYMLSRMWDGIMTAKKEEQIIGLIMIIWFMLVVGFAVGINFEKQKREKFELRCGNNPEDCWEPTADDVRY